MCPELSDSSLLPVVADMDTPGYRWPKSDRHPRRYKTLNTGGMRRGRDIRSPSETNRTSSIIIEGLPLGNLDADEALRPAALHW